VIEWIEKDERLLLWMAGASAAMLLLAVLLLPVLLARMPADYFTRKELPSTSWRGRHPLLRASFRAGKNVIGLALVLVGIPLIPLPGQGLLTILAGLTLLEFPGKRRLELLVIRLPGVFRAVNWLRRRACRPPLELDGVGPGEGTRDPAQPRQ